VGATFGPNDLALRVGERRTTQLDATPLPLFATLGTAAAG